jgi:hypothetical protein
LAAKCSEKILKQRLPEKKKAIKNHLGLVCILCLSLHLFECFFSLSNCPSCLSSLFVDASEPVPCFHLKIGSNRLTILFKSQLYPTQTKKVKIKKCEKEKVESKMVKKEKHCS